MENKISTHILLNLDTVNMLEISNVLSQAWPDPHKKGRSGQLHISNLFLHVAAKFLQ